MAIASLVEFNSSPSSAPSAITAEVPPSGTYDITSAPGYMLVGGQNGSWGEPGQYPALYKVDLTNGTPAVSLLTVGGEGTVWSGGYNGTTWLISGWGSGKYLDPYITLYDGTLSGKVHLSDYSQIGMEEQEWNGGDIFSVGWNGTSWLLTGMGSGVLPPDDSIDNHMSIATLSANGVFTDLSTQIPHQGDMILYANAWNGKYWLVGGGWYGWPAGKLFIMSGDKITDMTGEIAAAVPTFNSIQSISWNGQYFLIGGVGFLAEYDGHTFTDLTGELNAALGTSHVLSWTTDNGVNAIAWNGQYWMLAGGTPVADYAGIGDYSAWVASIQPASGGAGLQGALYTDLTTTVIPGYVQENESNSTILTMACWSGAGCAIGGADSAGGLLMWYNGVNTTDLSSVVYSSISYIQWIGLPDS